MNQVEASSSLQSRASNLRNQLSEIRETLTSCGLLLSPEKISGSADRQTTEESPLQSIENDLNYCGNIARDLSEMAINLQNRL